MRGCAFLLVGVCLTLLALIFGEPGLGVLLLPVLILGLAFDRGPDWTPRYYRQTDDEEEQQ